MGKFSAEGFFTLNDLDEIQDSVNNLRQRIEGTLKAFRKGTGDLVHFKMSRSGGKSNGGFVPLTDIGFDITRLNLGNKLEKGGGAVVKFGQDFTEAPIVVASIESAEQWVTVIEKVDTKQVSIKFWDAPGKAKGKTGSRDDFLNVIAMGKTKN